MVDHAVAGIENELQDRMRMGVVRPGADLHRDEEEGHQGENADERSDPASAPDPGTGSDGWGSKHSV